ncbi:Amidase [Actinobacteria bacterium OK074]|nr:Amidase [Actinobacteria bacterium OK074]
MREVLALGATAVVRALKRGELSPLELLDAVEERIAEVEPAVGALPVTCLDRARRQAKEIAGRRTESRVDDPGWLGGLPVSVKDMVDVSGVPTTYGSPGLRGQVAAVSDPLVERIERHGGIVVGKTNLPEFCSGADTVNPLHGRTRNPWDPTVSCGASSGGAAVSVAAGEVWCAHGEDTAGSLRIPAAFTGVVGLRPSPAAGGALETHGPLARDVADAALFHGALTGGPPLELFPVLPARVAFTAGYAGRLPVEPDVARVFTAAVGRIARAGCRTQEHAPALGSMQDACLTLIAHRAARRYGDLVDQLGDEAGPLIRAEVTSGRSLSEEQLLAAELERAAFAKSFGTLFDSYDVLLTPTMGCAPWPVPDGPSPLPADEHLLRVLALWPLTTAVTMAGCPAVSLPCGRTPAGLPVGLQLIGAPGRDTALLRTARAIEEVLGDVRPPLPVTPGAGTAVRPGAEAVA